MRVLILDHAEKVALLAAHLAHLELSQIDSIRCVDPVTGEDVPLDNSMVLVIDRPKLPTISELVEAFQALPAKKMDVSSILTPKPQKFQPRFLDKRPPCPRKIVAKGCR